MPVYLQNLIAAFASLLPIQPLPSPPPPSPPADLCQYLASLEAYDQKRVHVWGHLRQYSSRRILYMALPCEPVRIGGLVWRDAVVLDVKPQDRANADPQTREVLTLLDNWAANHPQRILTTLVVIVGTFEVAKKDPARRRGYSGWGPEEDIPAVLWIESLHERNRKGVPL